MPEPIDYRDHPEKYRKGDFPPLLLKESYLPKKCKIIFGSIQDTLKKFIRDLEKKESKIGFVSVDVDYYTSTKECLNIFLIDKDSY